MQHDPLAPHHHRVAGIVAALRAHHPIHALGQHVNNFAFALIAPLGANQNGVGHGGDPFGSIRSMGVWEQRIPEARQRG